MVTLADVARHAGVAVSTVSYALSGKRSISPDTRERIEVSMNVLGYRTDRLRRTGVLGVVLPEDVDVAWTGEFLAALAATARQRGADVLVSAHPRQHDVGAVVVVSPAPTPVAGIPVVRVGPGDGTACLCRVDVDRAAAGVETARHLADLGHRTVVYAHRTPLDDVYFAFAAALAMRGGVVHPAVDAAPLLTRTDQPTAVVAADGAALDAVLADLDQYGLRVPQDVSVIAQGAPRGRPVTSVSVSPGTLGHAAAEAVLTSRTRDRVFAPHITSHGTTAHRPS